MRKIALTTGDPDGIGPEVTAKALRRLGPQDGFSFLVFRDSSSSALFQKLRRSFQRVVCSSLPEALELPARAGRLIEIVNEAPAPRWVSDAATSCLRGDVSGLVTGPLSKTLIQSVFPRDLGHTEILQRVSGVGTIYQGYLGAKFCVVLTTAHLPLKDVPAHLTKSRIEGALRQAFHLREVLSPQKRRRPLAFVGLNPHAGEGGLLGREELSFRQILARLPNPLRHSVLGPLVPDAAFNPDDWRRYSVYVVCYHDQGLIPFKMVHGRSSGAQVSLGLPFVRTSVDHGTAKEIAGRGIADPGSMVDAIQWCLKLTKRGQ
ncbi:MAG: 4-hydroxythreonine-4-phosphate dehydrogenase PdxA [Bdellovibrionaceae bacterium]|nr:4-hydroxythreonine-4-phosphate dehydrogenase PdxA [Pseudobdellovibrionaceae bacterium]